MNENKLDPQEVSEETEAKQTMPEEEVEDTVETSTYTEEGEADPSASEDLIAELRKQADEHYQRLLRTQADFDNFRRRSRQEKEEFAKYAAQKLIEQLLPVIDNFERAIQSSKETQDFDGLAKGIDIVFRQFDTALRNEGVTPIESVGQPFNPEFHEAIMQVESDEHEEGIVVEEVQKGYMLNGKVIRPSMVKVSM